MPAFAVSFDPVVSSVLPERRFAFLGFIESYAQKGGREAAFVWQASRLDDVIMEPFNPGVFHLDIPADGRCALGVLRVHGAVASWGNAAARRILGRATEEKVQAAPWHELVRPKERETLRAWFAEARGGGSSLSWEGEVEAEGSPRRWLRIHYGDAGPAAEEACLLFIEDITDAKIREATVIANQDHFHALIERSAEGISIFDGMANIVYESPANKRIHGFDAEEMNGRNLFDFCHPDDKERVLPTVQRIAEKPGNVETDIVRFRHKDGRYIYLEGTVLNAFDDPRINGMVNNFRDVTGRMEAERELKQAKEAAEQAHRLQKHFLANISHEFKTPLTLIKQPLQDLESLPPGSEEARPLRALVNRNLERLEHLISELIELSIIDAGEFALRARRADFAAFLREQAGLFERTAGARNIRLTCEVPEACPAYFDARKMASVVGNLLSNALKFTDAGGRVALTAVGAEDVVAVSVRDNGRGMTSETARRVFDRFFQGQVEDDREYEGMGIGLAITREIVELHGGTIEVESAPGEGSEFRFTLPLGVGHLKPDDIDTGEAPEPGQRISPSGAFIDLRPDGSSVGGSNRPRLLLVEDNQDMCAYLRLHLESRYCVAVAANGEEALEWLKTGTADLILSDVMMPRMDGLTLCGKLRERPETASIPIMLLSAKGVAGQRVEGLKAGANDYLPKPFSLEELHLRLEKLAPPMPDEGMPSADRRQRERILTAIAGKMGAAGFGVANLASMLGYSDRHLQRIVFTLFGVSPSALLREQRLRRARSLIDARAFRTLGEVAAEVGFSSAYLARAYRAQFGDLPRFSGEPCPATSA